MVMDTRQIYSILKPRLQDAFIGVFPRDRMPTPIHRNTGLVLNIETHDQPGLHWVALYRDEQGNLEFWDSYGIHPSLYGINPPAAQFRMNTCTLQCSNSAVCGEYCIFYLFHRAVLNWSMDDIVRYFSSRQCIVNDRSVLHYVNTYFHVRFKLYDDALQQSSSNMHATLKRLYE
jgi:hypothetical protein